MANNGAQASLDGASDNQTLANDPYFDTSGGGWPRKIDSSEVKLTDSVNNMPTVESERLNSLQTRNSVPENVVIRNKSPIQWTMQQVSPQSPKEAYPN